MSDEAIPENSPDESEAHPIDEAVDQALEAIEAITELPDEQRKTVRRAVMRIVTETFDGPLPHPRIFREYEMILPGSADRILVMAEREQAYRHNRDNSIISAGVNSQRTAQILGFILALVALIGAIHLLNVGRDAGGYALILAAITPLAGAFLVAQHRRSKKSKDSDEAESPRLPEPSSDAEA